MLRSTLAQRLLDLRSRAQVQEPFLFFEFAKGHTLHPEILLAGIAMGIAFAAPPGVVTAETIRRGARGGFAPALGVQLGSLIGDATYALLALAGLAALAQIPALQIVLGAFGALFLLYLAWSAIQSTRTPVVVTANGVAGALESPRGERRGAFLTGMALSLANPWGIAFWLSLGGALASLGVANADGTQMGFFFASFMFGAALWSLLLAVVVGKIRTLLRPAILQGVSVVCGIALGAFGVMVASRVVFSILNI